MCKIKEAHLKDIQIYIYKCLYMVCHFSGKSLFVYLFHIGCENKLQLKNQNNLKTSQNLNFMLLCCNKQISGNLSRNSNQKLTLHHWTRCCNHDKIWTLRWMHGFWSNFSSFTPSHWKCAWSVIVIVTMDDSFRLISSEHFFNCAL